MLIEEENVALTIVPTMVEINSIIISMDRNSIAAGPDGFNIYFYKSCQKIIKHDLFEAIAQCFVWYEMPRSWSSMMIITVP